MCFFKFLVPLLGILFLNSCVTKSYQVQQVDYIENTFVTSEIKENDELVEIISPYKKELDTEMNQILSYTPIDLHKKGFNSPLANLNCDMVLEESNLIYEKRHNQKIDVCLLNHGGIRRTFTKGNLTVRNIYELMPFENQAVVVSLSGEKFLEMINYLSESERGHPISGLYFKPFDESSIVVNGKPFDINKTYTVVTNDYLQKGGDGMNFLKSPVKLEMLDIKLRDLMLNYFEKHDTIHVNLESRILK